MKAGQKFLVFLAYTCNALRDASIAMREASIEMREASIEIQSLGASELGPEHEPDEPFLPQKPRARAETAAAGTPGNLMETDQLDEKCSKKDEVWTLTGKELGKGDNGKVVEVQGRRRKRHKKGLYALKEPLHWRVAKYLRKELEVMSAAKERDCQGVLRLTKEAPCIEDASGKTSKIRLAYVAPEMQGDIFSWLNTTTKDVKDKCKAKVLDDVTKGMYCLHKAGYIHGDLKSDNVLYKELDPEGCPSGVVLADFGLSKRKNKLVPLYDGRYFDGSTHLPDSLFDIPGYPDSLHIRVTEKDGKRYFMSKRMIDYCSLLAFALDDFKVALKFKNTGLPLHGCGYMGRGRKDLLPVRPMIS